MPKNSSHYQKLRKKWLKRHKILKNDIESKHKEAIDWISDALPAKEKLASGAVGALMLTNSLPSVVATPNIEIDQTKAETVQKVDKTDQMRSQLRLMLPGDVRSLTSNEETIVGHILSTNLGMDVSVEVDGKRLNRSYGLIGAEQHLVRFPGDTMGGHLDNNVVSNNFVYCLLCCRRTM